MTKFYTTTSQSDAELLDRIRLRDMEATGFIYDRHSELTHALAIVVLGQPEAAEMVMQDVLIVNLQ